MTDTVKDLRAKLDEAQRTIAELLDLIDRHRSKPSQRETELEDSRSAHLFMLEDLEQSRLKIELAHQEWMAALDAIDDPVFVHDKEFKILRANRAYQQRTGRPFKEIIGHPYFEEFPKATGPLPGCINAMELGEDGEEDEVIADGRIYRSRAFPVHDRNGVYLYSVHSMEDVTERKQAEEALKHELSRGHLLMESSRDGIAVINQQYEVTEVNSRFARMLGYDPSMILGMHIWDFEAMLTEEDIRTSFPDISHISTTIETQHRRKDGTIYDAEVSISGSIVNGEPMVFTICRDITERKRNQESLRKSTAALLEAQRLSGVGNWEWDIATDVHAWSEEIFNIYGRDPSLPPAIYPEVRQYFTQESWDGLAAAVERSISTGEAYECDAEVVRPDGTHRWITARGEANYDTEGKVIKLHGTVQDITERKQHETAMLRANHALRTISAGNQTLIHATDEKSLLQEMCDVAVAIGGYRMAWIGYARDDVDKTIEPVAQAGFEKGCPNLTPLSWRTDKQESCPAGDAIIRHQTLVVQDIMKEPASDAWRENARDYGYASCIALPLLDKGRAFGVLVLFDEKVDVFDEDEIELLEEMAADLSFGILTLRLRLAHSEHEQRLQRNMLKTVEAIASIVEMRDPYTSGHQRRVAELAEAIAQKMGMSEEEGLAIRLAGVVHDLGKIKIPAEILSKPGRLNEMEYNLIKMHPQAGYEILKEMDFSWPIAQMVYQHHERMNGSGYPLGIKGDDILPGARILAVADVMEAMSSHRPYRPGLGIEAALDELRNGRGNHFDTKVVDACTALFKEDGYELPQ